MSSFPALVEILFCFALLYSYFSFVCFASSLLSPKHSENVISYPNFFLPGPWAYAVSMASGWGVSDITEASQQTPRG